MRPVSERYLTAIKTACMAHAVKTYDGKPYFHHLDDVEDVLWEFGYYDEDLLICAFLHDIMEDCGYTKNDVAKIAGNKVANIVYLVSDHKGENREQRKPLEYYMALKENFDAIVIKLADRIANARYSIINGHSMGNKYQKEYIHFREMLQLTGHAEEMWKELDKLFNYDKI